EVDVLLGVDAAAPGARAVAGNGRVGDRHGALRRVDAAPLVTGAVVDEPAGDDRDRRVGGRDASAVGPVPVAGVVHAAAGAVGERQVREGDPGVVGDQDRCLAAAV